LLEIGRCKFCNRELIYTFGGPYFNIGMKKFTYCETCRNDKNSAETVDFCSSGCLKSFVNSDAFFNEIDKFSKEG
jgi:hypothetical protein